MEPDENGIRLEIKKIEKYMQERTGLNVLVDGITVHMFNANYFNNASESTLYLSAILRVDNSGASLEVTERLEMYMQAMAKEYSKDTDIVFLNVSVILTNPIQHQYIYNQRGTTYPDPNNQESYWTYTDSTTGSTSSISLASGASTSASIAPSK